MLARARRDTENSTVTYEIADLETLSLPQGRFDFGYSALAIHYVTDFGRLMKVVHRALVPGSHHRAPDLHGADPPRLGDRRARAEDLAARPLLSGR